MEMSGRILRMTERGMNADLMFLCWLVATNVDGIIAIIAGQKAMTMLVKTAGCNHPQHHLGC